MRADDIEEMKKLPFFKGIEPAICESVLHSSFLQRFPPHVILFNEGEPADFLHIFVDGQIELFSALRDRETTVLIMRANDSFIVAAALLDRIYLQSARVLTSAKVLMVPADVVRHFFDEVPAFARALAYEMAVAYRDVVRELKNQKLRTTLERLANWLLVRHKESGGKNSFELPFDKQTLASHLGLAPAVLSRSFAALAAYHVDVSGSTIRINDLSALQKLAHPSSTIDEPKI